MLSGPPLLAQLFFIIAVSVFVLSYLISITYSKMWGVKHDE